MIYQLSRRDSLTVNCTSDESQCARTTQRRRDALQTKIIEINLMFKPEVADAILSGGQFSHYDRPRIAQLCEKAGLYMRAMEHYNDLTDIRRVMANTHAIPPVRRPPFLPLSPCTGWLPCRWDID